jgi:hypothetical protein
MKKKAKDSFFLDKKLAYTGDDAKAWAAAAAPMIMAEYRAQKTFDCILAEF